MLKYRNDFSIKSSRTLTGCKNFIKVRLKVHTKSSLFQRVQHAHYRKKLQVRRAIRVIKRALMIKL